MMRTDGFLATALLVAALLGLASILELASPLFARPGNRRRRALTNLGLNVATVALSSALGAASASIALAFSLGAPGALARLGLPLAAQIALGFVVLDFSFGYLAHRAMHAWPPMWRVHRVHHSDPFVDATTALRNHPIEGLWRFGFLIVPIWLLGIPAEAVALQRLLTAFNGMLEHANVRLWPSLDRALSLVWVTPNVHKIHHSRVRLETDSNYGNLLSLYDRALRTFTPGDRASRVRYGLDDVDPVQATSLPALLALPFHDPEARSRRAQTTPSTSIGPARF